MKKQISILFFAVTLVLGIFQFSTSSFATEKKNSDEGILASESYTLYEPESLPGFDSNKIYKNGEIILESVNAVDVVVNKYYSRGNSIPTTINHQIASDKYTYSGTLQLKNAITVGDNVGYYATYSRMLSSGVKQK